MLPPAPPHAHAHTHTHTHTHTQSTVRKHAPRSKKGVPLHEWASGWLYPAGGKQRTAEGWEVGVWESKKILESKVK